VNRKKRIAILANLCGLAGICMIVPSSQAESPPIRLSTDNGFLRKADGRLNPLVLRPFNPRTLRNRGPN
jgi:hypothetical protein